MRGKRHLSSCKGAKCSDVLAGVLCVLQREARQSPKLQKPSQELTTHPQMLLVASQHAPTSQWAASKGQLIPVLKYYPGILTHK